MSAQREHRVSKTLENQAELSLLALIPGVSVIVFDRELRLLRMSGEAFASTRGIKGQPVQRLFERGRVKAYEPLLKAAIEGKSGTLETWSADERACYSLKVNPTFDTGGRVDGGVATFEDITARKHSDEARHNAQERFQMLFERAPIGIALLASDGRVVRANSALSQTIGYSPEQLRSKTLAELTHPDDLSSDNEQMRRLISGEIGDYQADKRYLHARGHIVSARLSLSLVRDRDDRPLHFIAHIQDLTEQRQIEQRLIELDQRDPLTGLLARKYFERELAQHVAHYHRDDKESALAVFDLNSFRQINETYGHKVGDELLIKVAVAMSGRLRATDLIARLGSDEFVALLVDIQPGAGQMVASELAQAIGELTIQAQGVDVGTSASYGVVELDEHTSDGAEVLAAAEETMRSRQQST